MKRCKQCGIPNANKSVECKDCGATRFDAPLANPAKPSRIAKAPDLIDPPVNVRTSLAKAYWVYYVLGSIAISILLPLAYKSSIPIPIYATLLAFSYTIWAATQVWAAANRYTGFMLFAVAAKIMMVIGLIVTLLSGMLLLSALNY